LPKQAKHKTKNRIINKLKIDELTLGSGAESLDDCPRYSFFGLSKLFSSSVIVVVVAISLIIELN
jgi:hypothetical protein